MLYYIHRSQCRTTTFVVLGFHGRKQTASTTKPLIPSFLVKVDILGIDLIVEAWVSDVQLVWRYSYNGTWQGFGQSSEHATGHT